MSMKRKLSWISRASLKRACHFAIGVLLSGVYLKVADFAPLLKRVSNTLLTWEALISRMQGIESSWPGVLPISAAVLHRITSMCRRFLWGGNLARVAWHTMCLSKLEGRLGLRDTRTWNDALLSKPMITSKGQLHVIFGPRLFGIRFPPKFSFLLWLAILGRLPLFIGYSSWRLIGVANYVIGRRRIHHIFSFLVFSLQDLDRDQLVCKITIQMPIESKLEKQEIKT
ncbi:hypothetical protein M9H77_30955 [Catharanthus roseus]|uniref:Uncharacterized protein n=1 Tax=Catharanthus roseus TaxID=4058 RepID=A0ACC0A2Z6_CATRO|nr:hypothetical protein M9H77_30955 [Catharanthus roseus]